MPQNLFLPNHLARFRAMAGASPVRAELTTRLNDRLQDLQTTPKSPLVLTKEISPETPAHHDALLLDMVLPTVEDVPLFLYQCTQALAPDGLLLATTLGLESFREFRAAWASLGEPTGHVIPLTDVQEAGALLQKLKLALPVVDRDVLTLTFPDFPTLYATLRACGGGNSSATQRRGLTTPRQLAAMETAYRRLFPRTDGRLPLTLEILYLHAFKPAQNQPQAAKRGSGKVSLVRIFTDPLDK